MGGVEKADKEKQFPPFKNTRTFKKSWTNSWSPGDQWPLVLMGTGMASMKAIYWGTGGFAWAIGWPVREGTTELLILDAGGHQLDWLKKRLEQFMEVLGIDHS